MLCIDHLYMYDSQKDGMGPTLITWGDGLSCERHVDAQNARNNELIPWAWYEDLKPATQDFHKQSCCLKFCWAFKKQTTKLSV